MIEKHRHCQNCGMSISINQNECSTCKNAYKKYEELRMEAEKLAGKDEDYIEERKYSDNPMIRWAYTDEYMGKLRGATAAFCCKPGAVTVAAIGRIEGNYVMHIFNGEALEKESKVLAEVRDIWPQAFIKVDIDFESFIQNVRTGHSLFCYGDYKDELVNFCEISGITPQID